MRLVIAALAAIVACQLAACADVPSAPGARCATAQECQIQAYARAGG